jgi:hypothetical protein
MYGHKMAAFRRHFFIGKLRLARRNISYGRPIGTPYPERLHAQISHKKTLRKGQDKQPVCALAALAPHFFL